MAEDDQDPQAQLSKFLSETTQTERAMALITVEATSLRLYAKYTKGNADTARLYLDIADRQTSTALIAAKVGKSLPYVGKLVKKSNAETAVKVIDEVVESVRSTLEKLSSSAGKIQIGSTILATASGVALSALIAMRKTAEAAGPRLEPPAGTPQKDPPGDPAPNSLALRSTDPFDAALSSAEADLEQAYAQMGERHAQAAASTAQWAETLRRNAEPLQEELQALGESMAQTRAEFRAHVSEMQEAVDAVETKAQSLSDGLSVFTAPFEAIFDFLEDPPSISIPFIGSISLFPPIPRAQIGKVLDFFDGLSGFVLSLFDPIFDYVLAPIRDAMSSLFARLNPLDGVAAGLDGLTAVTDAFAEEFEAAQVRIQSIERDLNALTAIPLPDAPEFGGDAPSVFEDPAREVFFGGDGDDYVQGISPSGPMPAGAIVAGAILAGGEGDDRLFGGGDADLLLGEEGDDALAGRSGDDILVGGDGDDRIFGSNGDDTLFGGFGDDLLMGDNGPSSPGNDVLIGGGGFDTADFAGPLADYTIERVAQGIIVSGPEGVDYLTGIELLRFADGNVEGDPEYVLFGNAAPFIEPGAADVTQGGAPVTVDLATLGMDPNDDDDGTTLTYALTNPPADGAVTLSGAALTFDPRTVHAELALGESIERAATVTAEDRFGRLSDPQSVVFTVIGANDAPSMANGVARVAKDAEDLSVDLADLGGDVDVDDDGESLIYSISRGPVLGEAFVTGAFLQFRPSGAFDQVEEGKVRIVEIGVTATDRHGATSQAGTVAISVTGSPDQPNNAPSYVGLDQPFVVENSKIGARVGGLISHDPDGDALRFELVDDARGRFALSGGDLLVAKRLDHERSEMETIKVKVTDTFGDAKTQSVSVMILDEIEGDNGRDRLKGGGDADWMNAAGGKDKLLGRGGNDLLKGGGGADKVYGGGGDDLLMGEGGKDRLIGGGGGDGLSGGGGRDALFGGSGDDDLAGGGGRDFLSGGKGRDQIAGGGGADVFRFAKGDGKNVVTDFRPNQDVVEIGKGAGRFGQLDISRDGKDAVVEFANVEIRLEKVSASKLDADDFVF